MKKMIPIQSRLFVIFAILGSSTELGIRNPIIQQMKTDKQKLEACNQEGSEI